MCEHQHSRSKENTNTPAKSVLRETKDELGPAKQARFASSVAPLEADLKHACIFSMAVTDSPELLAVPEASALFTAL